MAEQGLDLVAIAYDGSPASLAAVTYACHFPATERSIIHVREQPLPPAGGFSDHLPAARASDISIRDRLSREIAAAFARGGDPSAAFTLDIRYGNVAEEVIAGSSAADLLLMTTRGRGVAGRAIFGSVANAVSRHGHRPTLLIRPETNLSRPRRVVVALDGGARAEHALSIARTLARALGCPMVLVHVVDDTHLDATPFGADEFDADAPDDSTGQSIARVAAYLRELESRIESDGFQVDRRVILGQTIPALVEFADPADIVVVAPRGQRGLRLMLEPSVADNLVRRAPAPVLVVHAPPGDDTASHPVGGARAETA